jgi:hypothetical protein
MAKRTTMRSSKGTKLYAVRDKGGKFKDIQTYKRAHTMDMKRKSKDELEMAAKKKKTKKASKKVAKKTAKKTVKKAVKKTKKVATKRATKKKAAKKR